MKTRWLDRRIAAPGPYLTLCLSESEFRETLRRLKPASIPRWTESDATTHHFEREDGNTCCVVCLRDHAKHSAVEVAGLLVHEAVHVWQQYCADIGEQRPGDEQEAYAVQSIAQELMAEFARRIAIRRGKVGKHVDAK